MCHKFANGHFSRISLERYGSSDFCLQRFIGLDGAYIIAAKKREAVAENFTLGGAKMFSWGVCLTSGVTLKKSLGPIGV